jgi:hypothetical protein
VDELGAGVVFGGDYYFGGGEAVLSQYPKVCWLRVFN